MVDINHRWLHHKKKHKCNEFLFVWMYLHKELPPKYPNWFQIKLFYIEKA